MTHLCIEIRGVTPTAESACTVPAMLTPPHSPHDFTTRAPHLLHAHRAPPLRGRPHSTERSEGPAAWGAWAAHARLAFRVRSGAVAQARTASAEMIQREPRFTAHNSRRAIAQRMDFGDTPSSSAREATV